MNRRRLLLATGASGLCYPYLGRAQSKQAQSASTANRQDYAKVVPRPLVFPADHGAHPAFRTEWWYLTAWMGDRSDQGSGSGPNAFGLQITFFRRRTG
ncbi:MAG TPA: carotenoid 1,2-hydratase, partial [Burkholderiales bacterium]|nr:carotenoid 1,2-hydratase [Burkholderiales bacterium]